MTRWKKLGGDVVASRGPLFLMSGAIAVGIFAVAAIATAYAVLSREIDKDYLSADPPSALLELEHLDDAGVAGVRRQAGIAWANAGGSSAGRIEVEPGRWLPLLLFTVPDFAVQHINRVELREGRWPDRAGEIVIERSAMTLARASLGHRIEIRTSNASPHEVTLTGVVHDPTLAPASQQQAVYGYVTPATLQMLGERIASHSLNVALTAAVDTRSTERVIIAAARWLQHAGYGTGEIRIPPRHHPHWGVMSNIVRMLLAFSMLALILSALLSAMLTAGLLAPQIRQIGVMKAIGARTHQIMTLYLSLIAAVAVTAVAIGLPMGVHAGGALAGFVARNQNIDLSSLSVPGWLYLALAAGGVAGPLLLALVPITLAARRTVRESLFDYGVVIRARTPGRSTSALFQGFPLLTLAVRNSVRRRARLALTLGVLATAGALFITSFNILAAWRQNLVAAGADRRHDLEIRLVEPRPVTDLKNLVARLPGVRTVEVFDEEAAAIRRDDGLIITRTFPDGVHGSLSLDAVPADSAFVHPNLIAGRWLTRSVLSGSVLNEQALAYFPDAHIGDFLELTVRGRAGRLRLAGVVREHLAGATIYLTSEDFAREFGQAGFTAGLRLGLDDESEESQIKVTATLERLLENAGIKVAGSTSRSQVGRVLAGHLFILVFVLIVMSALMALVGMFGLGSAMAMSVLERRRELAVLRAIGAGNAAVLLTVLCEGVFIGFLSVIAAAVLSIPVTLLIANFVGSAMLGPWQGVVVSATPVPVWLAVVVLGAAFASACPARGASRMTIHEALAHP